MAQKRRRGPAPVKVVRSQLLGIEAEIILNKETLHFECKVLGQLLKGPTAQGGEDEVRKLLKANEEMTWEPVILIEPPSDRDRGFGRHERWESASVALSYRRVERTPYRYENQDYYTHQERAHSLDVHPGSHEHDEREQGKPGHFSPASHKSYVVLPYEQAAWDKLEQLRARLEALDEALKELIRPEKAEAVKAALIGGGLPLLGGKGG